MNVSISLMSGISELFLEIYQILFILSIFLFIINFIEFVLKFILYLKDELKIFEYKENKLYILLISFSIILSYLIK